jgi:hypothetical protein
MSSSNSEMRCSFDHATVLIISRLTLPIALSMAFLAVVLISHFLHMPSESLSDGRASRTGGCCVVEGSQYSHTLLTVANCFFIEYQSFQSLCFPRMIQERVTAWSSSLSEDAIIAKELPC